MTICLIRHGQTDWNKCFIIQGRYDKELNQNGINQINATALRLKNLNIKWDIYLSSPLSRAVNSCKIIKQTLTGNDDDIIIREGLTERMFGQAEGLVICDDVYEHILKDFYEGMEKTEEIQKRALNEILEISRKYKDKNILITTHSHFIKGLFTAIDRNITFQSYLANGGLNFIEIEDGKIVDYKFNQ